MNDPDRQLIPLFERCSWEGATAPWVELLSASKDLVTRCFLSGRVGSPADLNEFLLWLPGWMFSGRKIQSLLRKRDRLIMQSDTSLSMDEQERFAANYFATIVSSGRADFYNERKPSGEPHDFEVIAEGTKESATVEDLSQMKQFLAEVLDSTPLELRVPFRLRYWSACEAVTDDEVKWISEQSGISPNDITARIQQTLGANQSKDFPFNSSFICDLLGNPNSTDKDRNTIDQRIRRVKLIIKREYEKGLENPK